MRNAQQTFRDIADVFVEVGNDESARAAVDGDLEANLLDRADDQNEVI
jgi:hypothetical protein